MGKSFARRSEVGDEGVGLRDGELSGAAAGEPQDRAVAVGGLLRIEGERPENVDRAQ